MKTQILILCNGQQRRLPMLPHPKHMLEVGGEPIIERTIRLLYELQPGGAWAAGVIGPAAFDAAIEQSRAQQPREEAWRISRFRAEDPGHCIVDGILAARATWHDPEFPVARRVILLGDVVWSRAALTKVLAETRPLVFAGTPVLTAAQGEVFALVFDNPQHVKNLCETCPCRMDGKRVRTFPHPRGGHLRRLLWHAQEARGRFEAMGSQTWDPALYLPIDDWTDDVDTPDDVARLPTLAQFIAIEDRNRKEN